MHDELINRLRECSAEQNGEKTLWHQAADAIEELLAEREENYADSWKMAFEVERDTHRWIPVTERLPEDKERVLIFYLLSTKPKIPWYKVATFSTKLSDVDEYDFYGKDYPGFYGSDPEYGYYEHTDVTHWMPLPQPPKDGEA